MGVNGHLAMDGFDLVTAADVQLMQGLGQRITAIRPDLVNSDATYGELSWIWGKGHASDGRTWARRLWFSGDVLVAWAWAYLPHRVRGSDGSVKDVTSASLGHQVHPEHAALIEEVIDWYDPVANVERSAVPLAGDEFARRRRAAHGYVTDPVSLGDTGYWTQLSCGHRPGLRGTRDSGTGTHAPSAPPSAPTSRLDQPGTSTEIEIR